MSVLVTGASGFLGCPLVESLTEAGCQVIAVGRGTIPKRLSTIANLEWVERDIAKDGLIADVVSSADVVFHLAGAKDFNEERDECLFIEANEKLTIRLIQACSRFKKKVIFASSQMVYGDPDKIFVTEDFPLMGMDSTPYACSKINTENWLRCMQKNHGGSIISLRFCGFLDGGGNIDYMIDRALHDESIELFSKGMVCRDYLTIEKAVEAFLLAAAYHSNAGFEVFNIGSGKAVSTYELAKLICAELGSRSEIVLSDRKAPRANFVFNLEKAVNHLGFVPEDLRASISAYAMKRKSLFIKAGLNGQD